MYPVATCMICCTGLGVSGVDSIGSLLFQLLVRPTSALQPRPLMIAPTVGCKPLPTACSITASPPAGQGAAGATRGEPCRDLVLWRWNVYRGGRAERLACFTRPGQPSAAGGPSVGQPIPR